MTQSLFLRLVSYCILLSVRVILCYKQLEIGDTNSFSFGLVDCDPRAGKEFKATHLGQSTVSLWPNGLSLFHRLKSCAHKKIY